MSATFGKQGFGYWKTSAYPIGGDFRRFGANDQIDRIEPLAGVCHGATHKGFIGKDSIAVNLRECTETRDDVPAIAV